MSGQIPPDRTASEVFAYHAATVRFEDLPDTTLASVSAFVLDTIGVGVAGAAQPYAQALGRALKGLDGEVGPVGRGAHVWGGGAVHAPGTAAYLNAFQAHCQEFDCVHEGAVLHPFTVVTPALLAHAEAFGLDGRTFIAACVAGVDVAAGLGLAATSQIRFFRPATCGLFGAVAALGRAQGLSGEQIAHAFGYALAFASGTMQAHVEGTPALAASVGAAARSALEAVAIAKAGLPGPKGALDGPFGYLTLFEASHEVGPVLDALGRVRRVEDVSWKPFPTGRAAHGGIDMMLELRAQGVEPDAIEAVAFYVPPLIHHLVGRPIAAPLEVNYARLCLPYAAAHALRHGDVGLEAFSPSALNDEQTHRLASRISVTVTPNPDPAAFVPQRVEVRTREGRVHTAERATLLGSQARPLSADQQARKFMSCWRYGRGEADGEAGAAVMRAIGGLAELEDVGVLNKMAGGAWGVAPAGEGAA